MKAVLKAPAEPAVAPRSITLDAQVNYLSGGPAGLAPVKLRTVLEPAAIQFGDYEGFAFAAGDVKEGVEAGKRAGGRRGRVRRGRSERRRPAKQRAPKAWRSTAPAARASSCPTCRSWNDRAACWRS